MKKIKSPLRIKVFNQFCDFLYKLLKWQKAITIKRCDAENLTEIEHPAKNA